ncbi:hypothetical protein SGL43_00266 [Streptomyces globisporus]|uniref:Uncharacterized protein n=1 Tax=Streptomyces globisporus TaxID=1908 RepID=A0ABN8UXK9_STRGL|nr:hypothetical protein SGL43_00266 [Streptomyces globisporus]
MRPDSRATARSGGRSPRRLLRPVDGTVVGRPDHHGQASSRPSNSLRS